MLTTDRAPCLTLQLTTELSTAIRDGVKATGLTRYKVVVHVTLGQRAGQAFRLASRGLWDATTDKCAPARLTCGAAPHTAAWPPRCLAHARQHQLATHLPCALSPCLSPRSFVSETFENESLFCTAQVYGVFVE